MSNTKTYTAKRQKKKVILAIVLVIIVAMVIDVALLISLNHNNADKTSTVLLNQVISIINRNERDSEVLLAALKEDYISKAETIAHILEVQPQLEENVTELLTLANLMGVDEIFIFNDQGVIIGGTAPQYYGYSFDSGEQMAYFKPMLENKSLTMSQDIMPNTAEGKNMMYSIVWNKAGDKMIQVGMASLRLFDELKFNKMSDVVSRMPAYEGIAIYVANAHNGEIYGSTDRNSVGLTLEDIGLKVSPSFKLNSIQSATLNIKGYKNYCKYKRVEDYIVAVMYSTENNVSSFVGAILVELVYMTLAAVLVYGLYINITKKNQENADQFAVLASVADIYYSLHVIDLVSNSVREYSAEDTVRQVVNRENGADLMMRQIMTITTHEDYLDEVLEFTDLLTLSERMKDKKIITIEFLGTQFGWCRASFITMEKDENGCPTKVIYVTRDVDKEKRKEETLINRSNTDELTGFRNRRAYEDDIVEYNDTVREDNFVYISMDVNELKIANDNLGHAAGDELIVGACDCMKRCFGSYGRLYRTGGDEFAAIIFANERELETIKKDFEETTMAWKGKLVDHLSVSCGYVAVKEVDTRVVHEIAKIADKRMYESKAAFYQRKGVDRRGQKAAHTALCSLYTKILKINVTNDTYQVVNMDMKEQSEELGFADTLSHWFKGVAKSGLIHPDDVEEFLRQTNLKYLHDHFKDAETSISIFYRRRVGDEAEYKQFMMEIIPSADYKLEDRNLFLYVKNIDKA